MKSLRYMLIAGAAVLSLSGCQALSDLTAVRSAQSAAGQVADAVSKIQDPAVSNLSKAQAAACAGQAAANALTDMLNATGHQGAANNATKLSQALGFGCIWTLPAI